MRRWLLILSIGIFLVVAGWLLARAYGARRARVELDAARALFQAKRFDVARERLERVTRQFPGRGDVEYLLGCCERMENHPGEALAAWARVPEDAVEAPLAALATGALALETGRFALAETSLERASRVGKGVAFEARRLLGRLDWMTGRRDEYVDFLRSLAGRENDPSETLRVLWNVDTAEYPINSMRLDLAKALAGAPEDDRVWLALADVATRSGLWDEADQWLTRCEQARPRDLAVWQARLRWARAANRPREVARAAGQLPATSLARARALEFRAWLAERIDDRAQERAALEELLAIEGANTAALERLAALAALRGDNKTVAELRSRKAKIDAAHERYRALCTLPDPARHARELARAAEELGRTFDALTWWQLAARLDPNTSAEAKAARTRLESQRTADQPDGRTLAEVISTDPLVVRRKTAAPANLEIPTFTEEAAARGLVFTFDNGRSEKRQLPETMSGGVAVFDFDGDGWLDVYAMAGGPFRPKQARPPFGDRLFRNVGGGKFKDITEASGLAREPGGYGHGNAVGDYDNDGRSDLFLTRWGSYALYRNLGQGRFQDVTAQAGLAGPREYPTGAAWADLDNDGDLDLYVCHYVKWDAAGASPGENSPRPAGTYGDARQFPAAPDHVFRNDGGQFVDVTRQAGIIDRDGRGLGVITADVDSDGKTDIFVANDAAPNFFFRNQGAFRFTEEGELSGLSASSRGGYSSGTGIACGDFDGDARLDLALSHSYGEFTTLHRNLNAGLFFDRTDEAGLAAPTRFVRGFGLVAFDANNDGKLDLAQANGHTIDNLPATPYAMAAQIFLGDGTGKLRDVSSKAGAPWNVLRLARGLAAGDFDNDGRVDLLVVTENEPLALFHNGAGEQTGSARVSHGHFVTILLEGTASNRDGSGARVALTAQRMNHVLERTGGGSYLSASDGRLHFGLGRAETVDRIAVKWPTGRVDVYKELKADTGYLLREGDLTPKTLPGFTPDSSIKLSRGK